MFTLQSIDSKWLKSSLQKLMVLHSSMASNNSKSNSNKVIMSAIEDAVGSTLHGLGLEAFLVIAPLTETESGGKEGASPIPASRAWLLPLLKNRNEGAEKQSSLKFFKDHILDLARRSDAASANKSLTSHEVAMEKAKVVDLWALFPSFCTNPPDMSSFESISPILTKAINDKRYPQLLPTICIGLQRLAKNALEREDEDEISILSTLSTKILLALFSMVDAQETSPDDEASSSSSSQSQSQSSSLLLLTETISYWAKIAPSTFMSTLFKKIMTKLLAATQIQTQTDTTNSPPTSTNNSKVSERSLLEDEHTSHY